MLDSFILKRPLKNMLPQANKFFKLNISKCEYFNTEIKKNIKTKLSKKRSDILPEF